MHKVVQKRDVKRGARASEASVPLAHGRGGVSVHAGGAHKLARAPRQGGHHPPPPRNTHTSTRVGVPSSAPGMVFGGYLTCFSGVRPRYSRGMVEAVLAHPAYLASVCRIVGRDGPEPWVLWAHQQEMLNALAKPGP
jgi:hypothetical protein